MPVKNIAVPWENVFCVIPILQNGWLSTTKLQISISQLCAHTAKDKNNNKSPRTLLNVLQVLFGCESGSLTICCRLVGKEARWAVKLPTSLIDLCLMSKPPSDVLGGTSFQNMEGPEYYQNHRCR